MEVEWWVGRSRCGRGLTVVSSPPELNHDSDNNHECRIVMKMRMNNYLRAVCLVLAIVADDRFG